MLLCMSAYEDLRAVIFGQFIKVWLVAPASMVGVEKENLKKKTPRTRRDVRGTFDANHELGEFPLGPLVHHWRWEGELVH